MINKIIFLDTETTDTSDTPGMIQLAYIVCSLDLTEIKREDMFFPTDKQIDFGAMAEHHITPGLLEEKLTEDKRGTDGKKDQVREDFKDAILVAHNSPFDKKVLEYNGIVTLDNQWIDTYNIAYTMFTDDGMSYKLQALRYYLKCIFVEDIRPHDALSDVIVLKSVFATMVGIYADTAIQGGADLWQMEIYEIWMQQTAEGMILRKWLFGKYKGMSFAKTFKTDKGYFEWMMREKIKDGNTQDAVFNTIRFYLEGEKKETGSL